MAIGIETMLHRVIAASLCAPIFKGMGASNRRRRLFRRGTAPVLYIDVNGVEWRLGRHLSSVP